VVARTERQLCPCLDPDNDTDSGLFDLRPSDTDGVCLLCGTTWEDIEILEEAENALVAEAAGVPMNDEDADCVDASKSIMTEAQVAVELVAAWRLDGVPGLLDLLLNSAPAHEQPEEWRAARNRALTRERLLDGILGEEDDLRW